MTKEIKIGPTIVGQMTLGEIEQRTSHTSQDRSSGFGVRIGDENRKSLADLFFKSEHLAVRRISLPHISSLTRKERRIIDKARKFEQNGRKKEYPQLKIWSILKKEKDLFSQISGKDNEKLLDELHSLIDQSFAFSESFGVIVPDLADVLFLAFYLMRNGSGSLAEFGLLVKCLERHGFRIRTAQIKDEFGKLMAFGVSDYANIYIDESVIDEYDPKKFESMIQGLIEIVFLRLALREYIVFDKTNLEIREKESSHIRYMRTQLGVTGELLSHALNHSARRFREIKDLEKRRNSEFYSVILLCRQAVFTKFFLEVAYAKINGKINPELISELKDLYAQTLRAFDQLGRSGTSRNAVESMLQDFLDEYGIRRISYL